MLSTRRLGTNGPEVGPIGYGAMVPEGSYRTTDEQDGVRTIQPAGLKVFGHMCR